MSVEFDLIAKFDSINYSHYLDILFSLGIQDSSLSFFFFFPPLYWLFSHSPLLIALPLLNLLNLEWPRALFSDCLFLFTSSVILFSLMALTTIYMLLIPKFVSPVQTCFGILDCCIQLGTQHFHWCIFTKHLLSGKDFFPYLSLGS